MPDSKRFIPVAAPSLVGNEKLYVMECLDSSWISSTGSYIQRFEGAYADFCRVKHAITCSNGTVALHLALLALGIGPGDEVIVPTLTYIATANAVKYCGATPVFVDSDSNTWNINPMLIESAISNRTKAIIVVHLYGCPAEMQAIKSLAQHHGLAIIEDAAEAHGASYYGQPVGSIGDVATFSFYGNKIITTGEGGMVVTSRDDIADRVRLLRGQGMDSQRRYWFPVIGYNYRMTNVAAAIGLAQLEKIDWQLHRRQEIAHWYREDLREHVSKLSWQVDSAAYHSVNWMFTVVLRDGLEGQRDLLMAKLYEQGIETRPVFYPMHIMPPYMNLANNLTYPVAEYIAQHGINLPTWAGLTREDIRFISERLCAELS